MEVLLQLLNIALHTAEWCTPGSGYLLPEKKHIRNSRRSCLVSKIIVDKMAKIK